VRPFDLNLEVREDERDEEEVGSQHQGHQDVAPLARG
jgi:hypothetical protein